MKRIPFRIVAVASFCFTYLFFAEYLPPLNWVHIPYDLEGYHFSLTDSAFQAVSQGRFPEWDAATYSGMSFVGNIQAALFYPPTWLLFAANLGNQTLSYRSLEIFVLLHVWLGFLLSYLWLRGRQLDDLACLLGAGVFAFSGYMCLQLQHLGLVVAYSWFPLGLMGIDQANETRHWRPFLKVVAASALCFAAGYPPTWVAFAVCMGTYAITSSWRWFTILGTAASLAASLFVAAIQALPTWEMSSLMMREEKYGSGIKDPWFYLSYLLPNYFNFGMNVPIQTNYGKEYLYLGVPALLGIACLFRIRNPRRLIPFVAVGAVTLIFVTNPFELVGNAVRHSSLFSEIFRDWYFLAGLTLTAAALTAYGLDAFLKRPSRRRTPKWITWFAVAAIASWASWDLFRWLRGGAGFAYGWRSAYDPAIMLALFTFAFFVLRAEQRSVRMLLALVILASVGVDYKVFGTSKRFNAGQGAGPTIFTPTSFPAMDVDAYRQIRAHADYRILSDWTGPSPMELRSAGLTTPQGYDPFLTEKYRRLLDGIGQFRTSRIFDIDPSNEKALWLFGVRYVIISGDSAWYSRLLNDSRFHPIGSLGYYFRVFEYQNARPPFGWETELEDHQVARRDWSPERREFSVRSMTGGRFTLHEQALPGWRAMIDGKSVAIEPWNGAFLAISVPPGDHRVRFQFHSSGLRIGAWITFFSLMAIALALVRDLRY